jgi:predicted nucleic acid-binding protein
MTRFRTVKKTQAEFSAVVGFDLKLIESMTRRQRTQLLKRAAALLKEITPGEGEFVNFYVQYFTQDKSRWAWSVYRSRLIETVAALS